MADIDNLSIKITANTTAAKNSIDRLTESLAALNAQLNAIDTSGINRVADAATNLNNVVSGLGESGRRVQEAMGNFANMGQQGAEGLAQTADAAENLNNAVGQMAQGAGEATRATQELGREGQTGAQGLQQVANAAQNVARHTAGSSANVRSFGRATREASKNAGVFAKELFRIGKMLKLMITRMVLRKIIQGVLDGFKNLAQYSNTFNATLSLLWNDFKQLGNSIAAAVSPLLNAFAPAIHYIIQLCIKAVNVINQLISALTGMSTWTRAKTLTDDYAKSLDKSNKSAKALKKTVLGFDELNQLQDNNSGGGGGTSPADMFENVPIDPKILKMVDELKDKIAGLKKYWDAFLKGFKRGLGDDWKDKVGLITNGIARIQNALKDIWGDPKVSQARDRYFTSLATMLGTVAGTVARIGLNIGANLAQGIAQAIEDKSPEIKDYLAEMFNIGADVNDQVSEFAVAIGNISDVLVGENAIAATTAFTELFEESFMLVTENAARTGKEIVTLLTQPIIDNQDSISQALDGLFGVLATLGDTAQSIVKDIRDTMSDVWDAHLSPMFDSLTKGLSEIVSILSDVWNNTVQPVLQEFMDMLKPLWNQYIKPIADDIGHIIGIIGNLLAKLFQNIIIPYFGELINRWSPRLKDELSYIVSIVKIVFQTVSTIIQTITFLLRSFLQFFETGFTQGWGKACEELSASWAKNWDAMIEKVRGIANSIVEIVEKMINAIVHGINAIGDKIGDKLSNISFPSWLGGGSFSLKIPHLSDVSLPRFKNGGFPKENGVFMANSTEMLGKFSNGKTAVANNEQITNGIAQAVFNAITSANSQNGGDIPVQTTIYIGEEQIARAVTKGQKKLDRRYSPTMA